MVRRRLAAALRRTAPPLLALGLALASPAGVPRADEPVVILLSWDGVRHDYPERTELPALARMARDGARAERLVPVFPSNTFPNHVSLATGTHPDRHGIVDNRFVDRERGLFDYENDASWLEAEPLWVAAERQGVTAAVFFWVGSESAWRGTAASHRRKPFDSGVSEAEKVDQILAWLDLPPAERPRLVMAWWHGADAVGHRHGPDHPAVAEALQQQDRQLARLLAGLDARDAWPHTTLLLVSDHGMAEVSEAIDPGTALATAGVPARVVPGSAVAHVFLEEGARLDQALRVLTQLEGARVHRRGALPAAWRLEHPTRTGDLVLTTEPPRVFRRGRSGPLFGLVQRLRGRRTGMHGYDPRRDDMGAIFLALGRGVPAGARPGPVRAIDVAPTVAALLGIEPPLQSEGRALRWASDAR